MTEADKNPTTDEPAPKWSIEIWEPKKRNAPFTRWFDKLSPIDQAIVDAVIEKIIKRFGIDICDSEWGKPLGEGVYEVRIRQSLHSIINGDRPEAEWEVLPSGADRVVLLRIFCTFHGDKVVLLFQGYDKKKDPSKKRQQSEIARAKKEYKAWKAESKKS
uniref:hypothetical protein n=1 Tax=Arthrobacter sp. TaxID=1667 RepID=UPI000EB648AF|nr:hypothetical protein [Arthrobacter sp.]AXV46303.1 addiction module toxin [Arthrobacter sp.]